MRSAIGIDIGGTNIKIILIQESGDIITNITESTPDGHGGSSEKIKDMLVKALKNILNDNVIGIGFGVAGIIDRKNGIVVESPNIPSINGFRIKETFEKEFSLPVIVENDANTYAYAEKWVGTGKNIDNFIVLTLGTGLGGGIIYKGELFEGAAEIGHMVVEPEGRFCTCGSFGCLESYASGKAVVDRVISSLEKGGKSILKDYSDGNFYKITPEQVYKAALEGDSLSREVFREVGKYLGIGTANLVNIFSPEAIIIGGGLIGAWDLFIEELKKEFLKRVLEPLSSNVQILQATLKKESGSVGAAGLIFKSIKQSGS
ncbi:MAG: ROK family protein [Nitrospirae bacterium]|nr:ROK family protein [Nitrospirota bacterium]